MGLTVIDDQTYASTLIHNSRMVHVSGDVYAIVGSDDANVGVLNTVTIPENGTLPAVILIDTFTFAAATVGRSHIIEIATSVFAVVYSRNTDGIYVITIDIDSSGNIGASALDSLELLDANILGGDPHICAVSGDIYAIAYSNSTDSHKGKLVTVDIDSSGNIGAAVIGSYEFDSSQGRFPYILKVAETVYAISYRGADNDGWIKTLTIADNGVIAVSPDLDTLEFDDALCYLPWMVNVDGDVYALTYYSGTTIIKLVTMEITSAGAIGAAIISSLTVVSDASTVGSPSYIIHLVDKYYGITYEGAGNDGFIVIAAIGDDGIIEDPLTDTLEFAPSAGLEPYLLLMESGIVAIASSGTSTGAIWTISTGLSITYPIDHRFSGIVRSFWAGIGGRSVYEATVYLGGMSSNYLSPIDSREIPTMMPSVPLPSGYNRKDYATWLVDTGIEMILKLFGHFPTYEEWVAKMGKILGKKT